MPYPRCLPGALSATFWLLSKLPLRWLQALGGGLGLLAARWPGRYGRRLSENFRLAFPDATPAMLAEAARHAGRMSAEMPFFWMRADPLRGLPDLMAPHQAKIDALLAQGRGLIIVTPHLGSFEALAVALAQHWPLTALFKPPHNPALHAWIERMRTRPGMTPAPADVRGVRMLVKALRRGEMVGILPDQTPAAGEGAWAPFFGRPAYTMTLVHRLQRLTGAPVALTFVERTSGASPGFRVHCEPMAAPLPEDPNAAAATLNAGVEALVRRAPEQYLWGYNRYKVPAGAPPVDAATGTPAAGAPG